MADYLTLVDRRQFIQLSLTSAGALLITPALAQADKAAAPPVNPLGVFVRIEPDNRIVIGARRA
jgi:hypothetical protein